VIGLGFCTSLIAQNDSAKAKPVFKIAGYHASGLHYYGRTDSFSTRAVLASAELWVNKSFYLSATPVFTYSTVSSLKYGGTVMSVGNFAQTKHFANNSYLMIPLYRSDLQLPQTVLKAQLSSQSTWKNRILNIKFGGEARLSDVLDFGASTGIEKTLTIYKYKTVTIIAIPSLLANAGTRRFTKSYIEKRAGNVLFPGTEQEVSEQVTAFSLLDLELSAPLVLVKGKYLLLISPTLVSPQNLLPTEIDRANQPGNLLFSLTAGIKYQL